MMVLVLPGLAQVFLTYILTSQCLDKPPFASLDFDTTEGCYVAGLFQSRHQCFGQFQNSEAAIARLYLKIYRMTSACFNPSNSR